MEDYMKRYLSWLNDPYIDDNTKCELRNINDKKLIEDMFYKELEFGTGGLRGIIGPGTNRMNKYIVRKTTQGLANHINSLGDAKKRGVVIAYDSRHKSRTFAFEAAGVLTDNNIKAYVFEDLRPTPELSYAVRKLNASAGIVITASHNPPEYNGYKVYGEDGGQISPEKAEVIQSEIDSIKDFSLIKYEDPESIKSKDLFMIIGSNIDSLYIDDVLSLLINTETIKRNGQYFKIIYTPLHGTGNIPVRASLNAAGFKNVYVVSEQELPDPNFPTVKSPNPEEKGAFELSLKMANEIKPDVILGTDPDCDRLGVCVPNDNGEYIILTGNQIGALLADYIISQLKATGKLPHNPVLVKTIVTSELGRVIASSYGVKTIDTLTGFKFIGEKINEFEKNSSYSFIFGYEESYGYLAGTFVRDKDAVIASNLVCEMGAYYKDKGCSIYRALQDLYKKYGYYDEKLESITLEGREGSRHMKIIMENLRKTPPLVIGDEKITDIKDYLSGIGDIPDADVLQFTTICGSIISIRPSGTEPKMKVYYSANGKDSSKVKNRLSALSSSFNSILHEIK